MCYTVCWWKAHNLMTAGIVWRQTYFYGLEMRSMKSCVVFRNQVKLLLADEKYNICSND